MGGGFRLITERTRPAISARWFRYVDDVDASIYRGLATVIAWFIQSFDKGIQP